MDDDYEATDEPVATEERPDPSPKPQQGMMKPLLWIAAIPAVAVGYYFGFALPADNEARLEFERQKHAAQQAEEAERQRRLDACFAAADEAYWSYVKLNGTELKDGKVEAPMTVWNTAEARKNAERESCFKRYPAR